jgi:hypothetical protein
MPVSSLIRSAIEMLGARQMENAMHGQGPPSTALPDSQRSNEKIAEPCYFLRRNSTIKATAAITRNGMLSHVFAMLSSDVPEPTNCKYP